MHNWTTISSPIPAFLLLFPVLVSVLSHPVRKTESTSSHLRDLLYLLFSNIASVPNQTLVSFVYLYSSFTISPCHQCDLSKICTYVLHVWKTKIRMPATSITVSPISGSRDIDRKNVWYDQTMCNICWSRLHNSANIHMYSWWSICELHHLYHKLVSWKSSSIFSHSIFSHSYFYS